MQALLFRRILRQLKHNLFRYLALFVLIIISMGIVVSVIGSAESIVRTVNEKADRNHLESGQFSLFVPLTDEQWKDIRDLGITLEECFSLDFSMEDGSTLRLMKNRENINRIEIDSGHLAKSRQEIVLERLYASAHDISVGDKMIAAGQEFTVCGIGTTADYDLCLQNMGDMSADGSVFGTAFVAEDTYHALLDSGKALHTEEYCYSYRLDNKNTETMLKDYLSELTINPDQVSDSYFQEMIQQEKQKQIAQLEHTAGLTAENIAMLKIAGNLLEDYFPLEIRNLLSFVPAEENPRIKAASADVEININIGIVAGILVMILIAYVISVFTIHSIDQESSVIGALYALGLKRKQLLVHYTLLPSVLGLLGGILGTAVGSSPFMLQQMGSDTFSYFSIPAIQPYYNPLLLLYGILLPGLAAFIVSTLTIRNRLSRTALSLLRKEGKGKKNSLLKLSHMSFPRAFKLRQLLREKQSCIAMLAGIFLSLLLLILGLNCYILCHNVETNTVADTLYQYLYQLKYPKEQAPEDGYEAYIQGLTKEILGYDMEISIIGITQDNPFFPAVSSKRKNNLSISSSVANKFGLKEGDELILHNKLEETVYAFTVKEIVSYSPGLCAFMDIDSMRELFGQDDGYYNAVYSDHPLDIESGRLYAVSTRADVEKSASIFLTTMTPLITTLIAASVLIYFIVLYQMAKVMIERSAVSISLMKVFGYRDLEIRRLYLDGSFLLVAVGTLALLPLAKCLMDAIYPSFVANVACGTDFHWPPYLYATVYLGTLVCYLVIRTALIRQLKKTTPAEILKSRE